MDRGQDSLMLILGKGTLGTALHSHFPDSLLIGREDFDLSSQCDCDRLIETFNPTVVINTVAVNQTHDPWEILTVNFTSAVYLTLGFYEKMSKGQIINISSTSTLWPSYPGVDTGRLCYNLSKESLSGFGRHFNRKIVDDNKLVTISTLEVGKFPSKFNGFQDGMPISKVVDTVDSIMQTSAQQITVIK